MRAALPILHRDQHLAAIDKPPGLLVHRTRLDFHEKDFALQRIRRQLGQRVYPLHRLDKGTSGVLLFALDRETAAAAGRAFTRQQISKTYLAVVRGHPAPEGTIDHPLARMSEDFESPGDGGASAVQAARTTYRRLATIELPHRVDRYPTSRYALVEMHPETGRSHQLRRHLHHASHPIIGDANYGKGRHNRLFQTLFGCHRLLLACVEMRLRHPITSAPLTLIAPISGDFARVIGQLGWAGLVPPRWLARETGGPTGVMPEASGALRLQPDGYARPGRDPGD